MAKPLIVHVQVSGPTGSGKSAILSQIRKALESEGFCCASPDLDAEARMSPGGLIAAPKRQKTVIVLSEENMPHSIGS